MPQRPAQALAVGHAAPRAVGVLGRLGRLVQRVCGTESTDGDLVRTLTRPAWKESFPPREICGDPAKVAAWLVEHLPPMKAGDPTLTAREKELARMSAAEYTSARRAGAVTCTEYAAALVKRMKYYRYMNQFMYWDNMPGQTDYILAQAAALDQKAEAEGVEAIAPLYGLLVPAKGTMATTDFPSSAGVGLLHNCYAKRDADFVGLLRAAHAVIMGKTNVPEFAAGWISANYANGCVLNPYNHRLTTGGSSGGSASAVASYIAPVAVTEDTGGSTRHPAMQCQNFGYDPTRNHFPNQGNPGMCFTNDQVGLNARSLEDILILDAALLGTGAEHEAAALAAPSASDVRVGLPRYPFVEFHVPAGGFSHYQVPSMRVTEAMETKYEAVKSQLRWFGVQLIQEEWPQVDSDYLGYRLNAVAEALFGRTVNGMPFDMLGTTAHHSYSGQIQEWVASFLEAPVSHVDLMADIMPFGSQKPAGLHRVVKRGQTDESQFRYFIAAQPELTNVWNSYFDAHGVDVIMTPPQFGDACTYEDAAGDTVPLRQRAGEGYEIMKGSVLFSNCISYFAFKNIAIPKLVVPVGLDAEGRPAAVSFWGRAVPADRIYDDSFARTFDLAFLYAVKPLVDLIQADPGLRRVDAPLVADLFP